MRSFVSWPACSCCEEPALGPEEARIRTKEKAREVQEASAFLGGWDGKGLLLQAESSPVSPLQSVWTRAWLTRLVKILSRILHWSDASFDDGLPP